MTDVSQIKPSRRRIWFAVLAVFLALAILLGLGSWQLKRIAWKEALLTDIYERRTGRPVALSEIEAIVANGGDIEYRKVRLSGVFEHSRERHFFATHKGQTGYYVYTPVTLADGRSLFVNRGFVSFDMKEPSKRMVGQITGEALIEGMARAPLVTKSSSMLPDNDIVRNIFYWKDLYAMASSVGIAPECLVRLFVDADDAPNPGGSPQGGVTLIDLPNSHLQYAITWYGLAVALVIIVGFVYFRNNKGMRGKRLPIR